MGRRIARISCFFGLHFYRNLIKWSNRYVRQCIMCGKVFKSKKQGEAPTHEIPSYMQNFC